MKLNQISKHHWTFGPYNIKGITSFGDTKWYWDKKSNNVRTLSSFEDVITKINSEIVTNKLLK